MFNKFKTYVDNYDFSNDMISRKFYHTFRVVDYAKAIAKSENLNEHDTNLAFICALLHDIGRFEQAKTYKTYNDLFSVDHGDLGYQILLKDDFISEFVTNDTDKEIVLESVKNHNKYVINSSLDGQKLFFTKLVRDADKLDILDKQKQEITDNINFIDENAISFIKNHKLFKRDGHLKNDATEIVHSLSFVFDLNFKETLNIIKEKKMIERKLNVLQKHCDSKIVNDLKLELTDYINN